MASTLKVNTIQHTGGTTGMTIDSSGRILTPARPSFQYDISNYSGGTNYLSSTYEFGQQNDCDIDINYILQERSREYFGEGYRWYDLVRTQKWEEFAGSYEIGGNDAFWSFSDAYFAARGAGDATAHDVLIPRLVLEAGVSEDVFTDCFESGDMNARVQADMTNAGETGGGGTPWSILIGPSGKTYPINGALPVSAVEQLISVAKAEA